MTARLNWLMLPLSNDVTVGAAAVDVLMVVANVLALVVVDLLVVVRLVDVVVGSCLLVVVVCFVVVVVLGSGAGSSEPNNQLPYATPWSKPPGTRSRKRLGERSMAP